MIKKVYSFFSSAHTDEARILLILMITSFIAGIMLGGLNFFLHNIKDANVGIILSLFSFLIAFLLVRESVKTVTLINITLVFSFIFFYIGFKTTEVQLESVIFLVIYPIPAILLRPFKTALIWIIAYAILVLTTLLLDMTLLSFNTYEIFQLLLIQVIIVMLLGYYVFSMKLSEARLKHETKKLSKLTHTLEDRVKERTLELQGANWKLEQYKGRLEKRVQEEMQNVSEKENLLKERSRMASMGEMIDAIAHQWKQPLNAISMAADMIKSEEKPPLDEKLTEVNEMSEIIHHQIEHMTSTLSEFRSFFRPNKESKVFSLDSCINSVKILLKDELIKNGITIQQGEQKDILITGYENEFKHLLLNLINNSKDAFNENNIKKRIIAIGYTETENHITIQVVDNAGGIPEHIIKDIFHPNVTTKADKEGTGIGLYMSSQIVQKHRGKLSVINTKDGARFTITIRK